MHLVCRLQLRLVAPALLLVVCHAVSNCLRLDRGRARVQLNRLQGLALIIDDLLLSRYLLPQLDVLLLRLIKLHQYVVQGFHRVWTAALGLRPLKLPLQDIDLL